MKFKSILLVAAAAALVFSGCKKDEDLGDPDVKLESASEIVIPQEGTEAPIEVKFVSTMKWSLSGYDDAAAAWLTITPKEGKASNDTQTLKITALANSGPDRSASIKIYGNVLHNVVLTISQPGAGESSAEQITVAEFIQKADANTVYCLKGKASNIADSSYYGFDLTDETGTIACAFPVNFKDFSKDLKLGDIVTIEGKYQWYEDKGTHQMANGTILKVEEGVVPSIVDATVAEVLKAKDPTQPYRLSGLVDSAVSSGSFTLTDATGSIKIYGADLGDFPVSQFGTVTVEGYYKDYYGAAEIVDGKVTAFTPGEAPEGYVAYTAGTSSYDAQDITANGASVKGYKIGKSGNGGSCTFTIPAGYKKVSFYAVAWNGKAVKLTCKIGSETVLDKTLVSNTGAQQNPPFTITAADSDVYSIERDFTVDTDINFATDKERALVWGFKLEK